MLEIVPDPRTLEESGLARVTLTRLEWEDRQRVAQGAYHLAGMPASAAGVPPTAPLVVTQWSIYWDGLMTALALTPVLLTDVFPRFGWDHTLVSDLLGLLDRLLHFRVLGEDTEPVGSVETWLSVGDDEEGDDDE